jgi:hypothetical protein
MNKKRTTITLTPDVAVELEKRGPNVSENVRLIVRRYGYLSNLGDNALRERFTSRQLKTLITQFKGWSFASPATLGSINEVTVDGISFNLTLPEKLALIDLVETEYGRIEL